MIEKTVTQVSDARQVLQFKIEKLLGEFWRDNSGCMVDSIFPEYVPITPEEGESRMIVTAKIKVVIE